MEIIGIEFDGYFLPYEDDGTSTAHYRSFMIYCINNHFHQIIICLLYTSDAADDLLCVDLGDPRILKKNTK